MLDHFSAKHSILVLSLPIKNMLDRFAFDVFLVVMAAHKLSFQFTYSSMLMTSVQFSLGALGNISHKPERALLSSSETLLVVSVN